MREVAVLRDVVLGVVVFHIASTAIKSYDPNIVAYHGDVTRLLLLSIVLLALPAFLKGLGIRLDVVREPLPLLLLAGSALVSCYFSERSTAAFQKLELYFSIFAYCFVLRAWLQGATRWAVPVILIALSVVHLSLLGLAIEELVREGWSLVDPAKAPYHGHVRHLSIHGMVAAAAGISIALVDSRLRIAGLIISALALFGIVFMGARGALVGWGVFVVVSAALLRGKRVHVILWAALALLFAVVATLALNFKGFTHPFSGSLFGRAVAGGSISGGSGRLEIWGATIQGILQRPVFGYGLDASRTILSSQYGALLPGQTIYQPHNTFLQFALELGLVGVACLGWLVFGLYRATFPLLQWRKEAAPDATAVVLISMCSGVFAYSMFDGLLYHAVPLVFVGTLLAMTYSVIDRNASSGIQG